MKHLLLLLMLPAFASAAEPRAACSIHFAWPAPPASWFYNEATVRESTRGSYFMVCGWNTGYFGIQELGDGRKVAIFSVWDPSKGNNPNNVPLEQRVEVLHEGKDVVVSRFGGEGTGGKSMMPFDWKVGEKVRCLVEATVEGEKTAYSGWLWMPKTREWKRLVTFRVKTGGKPLSGLYSFVEDFRRDGKSVQEQRHCEFGNGWVKTVEGTVLPVGRGTFTASKAESEARDLINAGQVPGGLFLATGGTVSIVNPVGTSLEVTPLQPAPPSDLPMK
jgi:Domain of unknown function (DUF3472)/Domain of unknown function (DUF5077)